MGKNKLVKENMAVSNETINFRERMIVVISEIEFVSLSPLIIITVSPISMPYLQQSSHSHSSFVYL